MTIGSQNKARRAEAAKIARFMKAAHVANTAGPAIKARKVLQAFEQGPSAFQSMPKDITRHVGEFVGTGLKPHLVKGSQAARSHMDYLRSMRKSNK